MNDAARPWILVSILLAALCGGLLAAALLPRVAADQGTADGGRRYVAVTGPYQAGVSVLYVLDQETQRLAVYEARGGAANSRRVVFVGARNIGLDTLLNGLNDESEYTYGELAEEFEKSGVPVPVRPAEGGEDGQNGGQ